MSRRTDATGARAGVFARLGDPDAGLIDEVNRLIEEMSRDGRLVEQAAEFKSTAVVLSATDTGRQVVIVFDERGIRACPYVGQPFDARIEATEDVHRAVLVGETDADAAFFAGKVRIQGSVVKAFRIKNMFLSLLQRHLAGGSPAAEELLQPGREKGDEDGRKSLSS